MTYITPRIIAMGFPASGGESMYRNSADEVYRYFETYHADLYKFYNLCSERAYNPDLFHGRVARYPFDDHHPPQLDTILPFCKDATDWLGKASNVVAVHCKAGKGRTGVMIACLLIYLEEKKHAESALEYFAEKRTSDGKGVTIPSQKRFVSYFSVICEKSRHRPPDAESGRSADKVDTERIHGNSTSPSAVQAHIPAATPPRTPPASSQASSPLSSLSGKKSKRSRQLGLGPLPERGIQDDGLETNYLTDGESADDAEDTLERESLDADEIKRGFKVCRAVTASAPFTFSNWKPMPRPLVSSRHMILCHCSSRNEFLMFKSD
mmetsp:Transcript_17529/g.23648  ORF Transcript_17529/g.23648 Transcript_17529/m.23648 type:complete len:323 (-) Transcript_17529:838-1806(-)